MRVLLVKPPFNPYVFIARFALCEPYELGVLAAALEGEVEVVVVDMRLETRSFEDILATENPDILGFTALTMDTNTVLRLANEARRLRPDLTICIGGEHATFVPHDFDVPAVDFVFKGNAVEAFSSVVIMVRSNGSREKLGKPGSYSTIVHGSDVKKELSIQPNRNSYTQYQKDYIFGAAKPISLWQSSSGCPYRCTFCSIKDRHPKFQTVEINTALENLAKCPTEAVLSIDAHALASPRSAHALFTAIATAGLKKRIMISTRADSVVRHEKLLPVLWDAGVRVVALGLESFENIALNSYNKNIDANVNSSAVRLLKQHGFTIRGNFIIDQSFDVDDFTRLVDTIQNLGIHFPTFQILTPLPGTALFEENKHRFEICDYDFFDLSHSVMPTKLPFIEFHEQFRDLFSRVYDYSSVYRMVNTMTIKEVIRGMVLSIQSRSEMSYEKHPGYH